MFFFAAQEYYQQQTPAGAAQNIRVPTALERGGDFSQTRDGNGNAIVVRDPLTGQPFPNNTIPSSRFAQGMRALLDIFPQPNAPEGGALYNYTSQLSGDIPRREDIFRFDWQAASSTPAQRPLHPQQGRGLQALRHDDRGLQLPAVERRAQERSRHDAARRP